MILSRPFFFFSLAYRIVSNFVYAGTAQLRIQWIGFPTHPHIHNPVGQKSLLTCPLEVFWSI